MKTTLLATLCLTGLLDIMPVTVSAQPYTLSANGLEVVRLRA